MPEPYAWNDEENREVRRAQRGKEGSDERPRVHGKDSEEVCKQWEATKDEESREAEPRATSRKTMPQARWHHWLPGLLPGCLPFLVCSLSAPVPGDSCFAQVCLLSVTHRRPPRCTFPLLAEECAARPQKGAC